ncbi:non-hydrolyzing UDP-N-acetylglucosamine 2-epimerase [Thiobacillus sedimenti]|uniref:UDP-N-acetylglucosamine 2-epimerase (Non-hydrolyzing) n=1 Tax=Thiobacillus sedimenti TaxID=3110231 RepID=A0ABZ1CJQ1_9PROT|nr:UDP-N-acetylglucosamine 2-epimerase (non-hydrolyzing) [Thiobacillus sp. SCUT-2]WRS39616.1 UDP-N-acetylglucosamine 2-epimerase (non-hydrolyzing) [Thiobacillus sp. SCUT-2]
MTQVLCIAGARPNFMKIAPVMAALAETGISAQLLHTGQHYDAAMSDSFFSDLGIPPPDHHLEVGSGTHAVQTAEVMKRFEPVLESVQPQAVLVVGDVNSTLACALVAAKRGVRVIHVEAGLRSYDRSMPEEINRVLTDQISDLLFTTERTALANLQAEGIDASRVEFVGNVMIDTLYRNLERAVPAARTLGAALPQYAVLTLHRPSNVDDPATLAALLDVVGEINRRLPVVMPLHPRTRGNVEKFGLTAKLDGLHILPPVGYLEMLGLMRDARLVLTDSGGIQEETTALGVPCLTLRDNTERPITIDEGTNTLVGPNPEAIRAAFADVMAGGGKAGRIPEYWDGRAAMRIAHALQGWLPQKKGTHALTGIRVG